MNAKKEATLTWEDAPDTITPELYAQIRGISEHKARDEFNSKGFPLLECGGSKLIADKTMLRLRDLGINPKNNPKQTVDYLILIEIQKLSKKIEGR